MNLDDIDPPEHEPSFGWGLIMLLVVAIGLMLITLGCATKKPPSSAATVALSGRLQAAAQRTDDAQNSSKAIEGHLTRATRTASRADGKASVILDYLRWEARQP